MRERRVETTSLKVRLAERDILVNGGIGVIVAIFPLKDSQSLVDTPQPELISHIVMPILRMWPFSLYLCSAERWVSMIVKDGFAIRTGACLDVDGGVAWTGDTVASVATFELALPQVRDGRGSGVID